jgi:hypothetical protein
MPSTTPIRSDRTAAARTVMRSRPELDRRGTPQARPLAAMG